MLAGIRYRLRCAHGVKHPIAWQLLIRFKKASPFGVQPPPGDHNPPNQEVSHGFYAKF